MNVPARRTTTPDMIDQARQRLALPMMTPEESIEHTDRIHQVDGFKCLLVFEARERETWKGCGFSTWTAYVEGELGMSTRNALNLIEQAEAFLEIEHETGERPSAPPSQREAKDRRQRASKPASEPEDAVLADEPTGSALPVATPSVVEVPARIVADPNTGEAPDVGWAPRQLPLWLEDLWSPIEKAADEAGVDPELWVRQAVEAALAGKIPHVEQRRARVAELAAQGLSERAIAERAGVSKTMVQKDKAAIAGQRSVGFEERSQSECKHPVGQRLGGTCMVCGASVASKR